jgi:hypothetical protein
MASDPVKANEDSRITPNQLSIPVKPCRTMNTHRLPLAYRWFLAKGLTRWQPWLFMDPLASNPETWPWADNTFAVHAFKTETGADFDVHLFARRQDMDDYAFFVAKDGQIQDRVINIHLSFAAKLELSSPLRESEITQTFTEWISEVVVPEVEDWMSEEYLAAEGGH